MTINGPREHAISAGDKHYVSNKPCINGHLAPRLTQSRHCSECLRAGNKRRRDLLWLYPERIEAIRNNRRLARGGQTPPRPAPNACECCGNVPATQLCADHDHTTSLFRGWLCQRCNRAIGQLGDCEVSLMQAVEYLRRTTK